LQIVSELTSAEWGKVALWGGVTVVSLIALVVVIFVLRRRLRDTGGHDCSGFDLEDLQKMRDRGDINEAEYNALRRQAIAAMMIEVKND
jgi:uncharacterized membrane protein